MACDMEKRVRGGKHSLQWGCGNTYSEGNIALSAAVNVDDARSVVGQQRGDRGMRKVKAWMGWLGVGTRWRHHTRVVYVRPAMVGCGDSVGGRTAGRRSEVGGSRLAAARGFPWVRMGQHVWQEVGIELAGGRREDLMAVEECGTRELEWEASKDVDAGKAKHIAGGNCGVVDVENSTFVIRME
ncbi:hypothetical protein K439DRAFT_1619948 [Ramaria rubella]|nr:hypothetical protein K439DRAFT_1619948 [Ramaria rubella]